MPEREQINVRVDASTKERWADHAEDSREVANLSALVRRSVESFINTDERPQQSGDVEIGGEVVEQLNEVQAAVQSVNAKMDSVQSEVEELRRGQQLDERIRDLLPPAEPHTVTWTEAKTSPWYEHVIWSGRVEDIADELEGTVTVGRVERVLERMHDKAVIDRTTDETSDKRPPKANLYYDAGKPLEPREP